MKTLGDIKDEYAQEIGFDTWSRIFYGGGAVISDLDLDEISKRFAKEVAKQALVNASKNAYMVVCRYSTEISKKSIFDTKNIPEI